MSAQHLPLRAAPVPVDLAALVRVGPAELAGQGLIIELLVDVLGEPPPPFRHSRMAGEQAGGFTPWP